MSTITPDEIIRYSRQLILPGWSAEKQLQLQEITLGISAALPSAALYLCGLGLGRISLIETKHGSTERLGKTLNSLRPDLSILDPCEASPDFSLCWNDEQTPESWNPKFSVQLLRNEGSMLVNGLPYQLDPSIEMLTSPQVQELLSALVLLDYLTRVI